MKYSKSINQSIDRPIDHKPFNQSINTTINQSTEQPMSQSTNQLINQSINFLLVTQQEWDALLEGFLGSRWGMQGNVRSFSWPRGKALSRKHNKTTKCDKKNGSFLCEKILAKTSPSERSTWAVSMHWIKQCVMWLNVIWISLAKWGSSTREKPFLI